ncbi:MAG: outer membrane beta-barrel protein [Undibacterium sp.]|nr:outer membrane beta-barrel protein [Opitutaceae bacterium]
MNTLPRGNFRVFATLALVFAASMQAAPFLAIGDGAELFVTGTVGVRADDNIFLSNNSGPAGANKKVSDMIFEIAPGLDLTFGKGSLLKGSLSAYETFTAYADTSGLNTNLLTADFKSTYDDGKLKLNTAAGYHELNQNAVDIRGLTRRDQSFFNGGGEISVSEKTAVAAALSFDHLNYKRAGYSDADTLTVPLNVYYKLSAKVDLALGYRYRDTQVQIGADSHDNYFNIGARGEFSPKLTGHFNVGYNRRSLSVGKDEDQLGFEADLAYELTPKTNLYFGASNDFGTSASGAQQKNFTAFGRASAKISEVWSLGGGLSYRSIDYITRTDDYIEGQINATYAVNAYVGISAAYAYRNNSSDLRGSEFTNNVFSLAANFRY